MSTHSLGIIPLLAWLSKKSNESKRTSGSKQVAFTDDLNGIGTVESLKKGGHFLKKKEKNGYNVNARKSYLIVNFIYFIYFLFIFNLFFVDDKIEYNLVYLCNNS